MEEGVLSGIVMRHEVKPVHVNVCSVRRWAVDSDSSNSEHAETSPCP